MGKTTDLFKKIRDTKGTFHAKMGTLKEKNAVDLTEADDIKKRWCWKRLLRVPWTARRSKHSILKEISVEYSLEGLMLKMQLQYFGHLMQRTDSLEKTLMLGKIETGEEGDDRG